MSTLLYGMKWGICQYVMGPLNTSSRAPKTKRAGWQGFGGNIFVAHGGKIFAISLTSSFPVRFFSEPWKIRRPLQRQLSLTPTLTLHTWISFHLVSSGLHWACITHFTTICAILTIDGRPGRKGGVSIWILLLAFHRRKATASCRRLSSIGGIPRCSRLCPWENGRNACVTLKLRSLSTHSSICFYFAVAFLHSGQPGFQLLLVRSSFFV